MSMELIAIIGVGATLAGLILNGQRHHRKEIKTWRDETRSELKAQREIITSLLERMAHLEGLLEDLREAIAGRRVAEDRGLYDPG